MFRGSFEHVLDDKSRVSLPKQFRERLAHCNGEPSIVPLRDCLAIYPAEVFDQLTARLASASQMVDSVQRAQRLIIGMSAPCPIDRSGRILIPAKLREWAALKRDVVFSGVGNRIEVWDPTRQEAELRLLHEGYAENMIDLKEFGL